MNWKEVAWKDVLTIQNGRNQKGVVDPNGPYPIYGSGGRMGYASEYLCREGCTIIGRKGTINKPIYVDTKFWNVDTAFGLCPGEKLDSRFFFYFCTTYNFEQHNKATTLPSLTKADLLEIKFPLPPLQTQKKIAAILDKADELIQNDQKILEKYDQLTQSVFLEMFGDPVTNPKGWEIESIGSLTARVVVGHVGPTSEGYAESGVQFIRTQNVRRNYINYNNVNFITPEFHNRLKKSMIFTRDVLISRVGVNRGMAAVVPNDLDGANCANVVIVGKSSKFESTFLSFYVNSTYGRKPEFGASVGSAQGVVNTSTVKKWPLMLPPRELQSQFAQIVLSTEEQKQLTEQSLKKSQNLFQSLLQKAFKGELDQRGRQQLLRLDCQ